MSSTVRLHFMYVVSILVAIIIGLLAIRLSANAQVVSYISFALSLASILLAVVATVYAFVSNASLAQSIVNMQQAAGEIRISATSLDRIAVGLEKEVGNVTEKVDATHGLIKNLMNRTDQPQGTTTDAHSESHSNSEERYGYLLERSSYFGRLVTYGACMAYLSGRSFDQEAFFKIIGDEANDYVWGWLMALDAAQIIDVSINSDRTWRINAFPETLRLKLDEAASQIPEHPSEGLKPVWNKQKISELKEYFAH